MRLPNRAKIAMRVLLVEDMDDLRETSAWLLRHAGCDVFAASCGDKALDGIRTFSPELVLTDLRMPDMDGVELIRRLRRVPGLDRVPVVMVTADDAWEVEGEARAAGASDFVAKPVDLVGLVGRYEKGGVPAGLMPAGAGGAHEKAPGSP